MENLKIIWRSSQELWINQRLETFYLKQTNNNRFSLEILLTASFFSTATNKCDRWARQLNSGLYKKKKQHRLPSVWWEYVCGTVKKHTSYCCTLKIKWLMHTNACVPYNLPLHVTFSVVIFICKLNAHISAHDWMTKTNINTCEHIFSVHIRNLALTSDNSGRCWILILCH